jgi:glycosyltransferase involved in cell wall biosynthesis
MKKILILDENYPSQSNMYANAFTHTRVKAYQKFAKVRVIDYMHIRESYLHEGVQVESTTDNGRILSIIKEYMPDVVFVHFYNKRIFEILTVIEMPVYIWVHGHEALGWYRRLFNFSIPWFFRNAFTIVVPNIKQMIAFNKLIQYSNQTGHVQFVFVSEWMKRIAETDAVKKIKYARIIPNPIDDSLFSFKAKLTADRLNILSIRPYHSHKYANDMVASAIIGLSEKPYFKELKFSLFGKGYLFKPMEKVLRKFDNVSMHETFIDNAQIPTIHAQYGVFLAPTRQDAQGVSTCEAMASGLVPISSHNTAVPEFIQNGTTGILTHSVAELIAAIDYLYFNPDHFLELSANAASSIRAKCGLERVIESELKNAGVI